MSRDEMRRIKSKQDQDETRQDSTVALNPNPYAIPNRDPNTNPNRNPNPNPNPNPNTNPSPSLTANPKPQPPTPRKGRHTLSQNLPNASVRGKLRSYPALCGPNKTRQDKTRHR